MPEQLPFSIKVFLPDGDPDGLRMVERSGWTGLGVVFKRTGYKEASKLDEFQSTGVYILVGSSEESAQPLIYVGEGDPVKPRLDQHYAKKDFWDWAVFFVTKDGSLNKAHVKHIESRLLELAGAAKQCRIDNSQPSLPPTLSRSETADAEMFLSYMLSILPLLGLGVFEKTEAKKKKPRDLLYIETKGIKATGYEDAKGFVVCKGSQIVSDEVPSIQQHASNLRRNLREQGVVAENGRYEAFTQDYLFSSPSTSASAIMGRSANGRIEWKDKSGKTLKELQAQAAGAETD